MVTLAWLKGFFVSHENMQKRSVYELKSLQQVNKLCLKKAYYISIYWR